MQRKISLLFHSFCDVDDYNAQNLNAREIALRLNPTLFESTMFYRHQPDVRCRGLVCLVKVPDYKKTFSRTYAKLPVFKHLLGKYDILFNRGFPLDFYYLKLRKLFGDSKITVYTIENPPNPYTSKYRRFAILNSDYVFSVSSFVASRVKEVYGLNSPVMHVGVDTEVFKFIHRQPRSDLNVLYVGSFQNRKRPWLVLEAAKRFPHVGFHLVGKGELEHILHNSVRLSNLRNVNFHGRIPLPTLVKLMHESDVFLFPSILEGLPKVTLEAASTGLPVIAFSSYQPETVVNGETGFIVNSTGEMMQRLDSLLSDRELRLKTGMKARKHAERFDWNIISMRWEKELIKMCEGS